MGGHEHSVQKQMREMVQQADGGGGEGRSGVLGSVTSPSDQLCQGPKEGHIMCTAWGIMGS